MATSFNRASSFIRKYKKSKAAAEIYRFTSTQQSQKAAKHISLFGDISKERWLAGQYFYFKCREISRHFACTLFQLLHTCRKVHAERAYFAERLRARTSHASFSPSKASSACSFPALYFSPPRRHFSSAPHLCFTRSLSTSLESSHSMK